MSKWLVSEAALEELAELLADQHVSLEELARKLAFREPVTGVGAAAFTGYLLKLAGTLGGFKAEHLGVIEKLIPTVPKETIRKFAVKLDLKEPDNPHLTTLELERLTLLVDRAALDKEQRFRDMRERLGPTIKRNAARSEVPREQWALWFRACARQDLDDEAEPWMVDLAQCAMDTCEDRNLKQAFEGLRERCKQGKPPWNLVDLLEGSQAPSSYEPPPLAPTTILTRTAPVELPTGAPKAGYALLIGISSYAAHGPSALKYAANDAQQVATYLRGHGDIDFSGDRVRTLTDAAATLRGVLGGLDWLRDACARSDEPDPLAVVYFSGHGMPDRAGRHYLVPHDGDRDQLFATALWNRTLSAALEQIPTQRLLVMLDACHAGGMVEIDGAKAGEPLSYDPDDKLEGLRLDAGRGRYFIASCATGQRSFEGEGNGLFTQALLGLLRFEELDAEKLDLADLYRHLRKRVSDAARRLSGGSVQTPTGNIDDSTLSTGLILAINQRRSNRLKLFLEAVCKHLQEKPRPQKATIKARLVMFVERGERPDDPDFIDLFIEGEERWHRLRTEACVAEVCDLLANQLYAATPAPESQAAAPRPTTASDFAAAQATGLGASGLQSSMASSFQSPTQLPAPTKAPNSKDARVPWQLVRNTRPDK